MFRREGPDRCQVCNRRFKATGSGARHGPADDMVRVYRGVGDWHYVHRVCERCWQRHEGYAAETRRRFVRDNPPDALLATLRDRRAGKAARIAAMKTLVELADPRAVPALCDQLDDPIDEIRGSVIEALGEAKDIRAADSLYRRLTHTREQTDATSFEESGLLASALAAIGDPRAAGFAGAGVNVKFACFAWPLITNRIVPRVHPDGMAPLDDFVRVRHGLTGQHKQLLEQLASWPTNPSMYSSIVLGSFTAPVWQVVR